MRSGPQFDLHLNNGRLLEHFREGDLAYLTPGIKAKTPDTFVEERLRNASAEHAEAIVSAYELLQLLHDRGVLELLRPAVDAGDQRVDSSTSAINTLESIRAIRNLLIFAKIFGSISPEALHRVTQTLSKANK